MTDKAWIKQQLKYLDGLRHEPKSLAPYEDSASILREARKRFAAVPAAVAACRERELVNPDAARVALSKCLEAIRTKTALDVELASDAPLTVLQAAVILNRPVRTVYQLVKDGRIEAQRNGKSVRITRAALDRFAENSTEKRPLRHLSL
jgi:excisionase family DNA binding protein